MEMQVLIKHVFYELKGIYLHLHSNSQIQWREGGKKRNYMFI